MNDEQRKAVALEYLKALDNGGVAPSGRALLDLFASDAQVYFPKWGVARGKDEIAKLFADVGGTLKSIAHHYSTLNWIASGGDTLACEGTSEGEHMDGRWESGRWCDVFEIRGGLIHRCFIYLDPDYLGKDIERYPWTKNVRLAI